MAGDRQGCPRQAGGGEGRNSRGHATASRRRPLRPTSPATRRPPGSWRTGTAAGFPAHADGFDNDRAWWGQALATAYWQAGDTVRRALRRLRPGAVEVAGAGHPTDPQLQGALRADAGHRARRRRRDRCGRALDHAPLPPRSTTTSCQRGPDRDSPGQQGPGPIDFIEESRKYGRDPDTAFPGTLDPTFASLKGNPRFEKLLKRLRSAIGIASAASQPRNDSC